MPWLLEFIDSLISELPEDLNAEVVTEDDELEVILLEADERWNDVGSKMNPQWLWLLMHSRMHSRTRQIVAIQAGPRDRQTAEKLFYKLPEPLKKSPLLMTSLWTTKQSPSYNTDLSAKNRVRRVMLKDLIARSDSVVQDL